MKFLLLFLTIVGIISSHFISSGNALERSFASAMTSTGKVKGYVIEPNPNRTNAVNVFKVIKINIFEEVVFFR